MPDLEEPKSEQDKPKRSSKRARQPKTSGQLRAAAEKKKAEEKPAAEKPSRPSDTRQYTCEQWARGRNDPVTRAFVSEYARKRTVKHTPAEWMALYRDWLKQPRG